MIKNKYRICLALEDIYSTHTYIKEHLQINLKKKKQAHWKVVKGNERQFTEEESKRPINKWKVVSTFGEGWEREWRVGL